MGSWQPPPSWSRTVRSASTEKRGRWVIEEGDGLADVEVAFGRSGAGFEGECALAGSGTHLGWIEALVDPLGALEAVEAGGG